MCHRTRLAAAALALSALAAAPGAFAQAGFEPGLAPVAQLPRIAVAAPDIDRVMRADAERSGPAPYRFAVPVETAFGPSHAGRWERLADGRFIWRVQVASAGALSLNFGLADVRLPAGAELRFYDLAGGEVRGPYRAEHVQQGQLWSPIVPGDAAVIELVVPPQARAQAGFTVARVNHAFRTLGGAADGTYKSGSCNVDIVCPAGDSWRPESRAVARYTVAGTLLCTGTLLNNTAGNFDPLLLTANHCIATSLQGLTTVFYWNYQTSVCGGTPNGSLAQSQGGATVLATSAGPDFTLLRLSQSPNPFGVFYAGWDNSDAAPTGVVSIHHPNGDEKRISHSCGQTTVTAYASDAASPGNTHLRVPSWQLGTTEGGSSGSGLWNSAHRVVGQLSGGSSACSTATEDNDLPDWYGRLNRDWFGSGAANASLRPHLDQAGTGAAAIDGADPATGPAGSRSGGIACAADGGAGGGGGGGGGGGAFDPRLLGVLALAAALMRRRARRPGAA